MTTGESHPVFVGPDTLVWWKESGLATVPLKDSVRDTLFSLVRKEYPEIALCHGVNEWEGGVMHRLDTLTSGLVLIARSQKAYDALFSQQRKGMVRKEYRAECRKGRSLDEGFPGFPYPDLSDGPVALSSCFRAYGPGRKSVRPVLESKRGEGGFHTTHVVPEGDNIFRCSLDRGFRHQIRCHLAWAGWPILGDTLYGGIPSECFGLAAVSISYIEPCSGRRLTITA